MRGDTYSDCCVRDILLQLLWLRLAAAWDATAPGTDKAEVTLTVQCRTCGTKYWFHLP
jgi:hypothetical protein